MSPLDSFIADHGMWSFWAAIAVLLAGGLVKGAIGFALPLIGISGLGSFLPAQTAVAILIAPMVVSNLWQTLRTGFGPAVETTWRFRRLLLVLGPTIVLSAQLLAGLSDAALYMMLGVAVSAFALSQLAGWRAEFLARWPVASEVGAALVGGFFGGLAGIWGPPVTLYLLATRVPKAETMRALGVVFGLGSLALIAGQIVSGVFNAQTAPLSLLACVPVLTGMALGFVLHDRIDARLFRKATLVALVLTGLNLLRAGLAG